MKKILTVLILGVSFALTSQVWAKKLTTEQRIQKLERLLDSKGLVEILIKLEELQKEVQILRGEVEMSNHTLGSIKKRQRDLYVDIDRRLLKLERSGAGANRMPVIPTTPSTKNAKAGKKSKHDIAQEQKAYQQAFDLLRDLRYNKSVVSFRKFLKAYPDGRYAHIAQYWIGEANYAQRNFKSAIKDYQALIKRYPSSPKLAEAMLKISYSYYELNNLKQADLNLQRLIKTYPKSTEAGQGRNLLTKVRLKLKNKS